MGCDFKRRVVLLIGFAMGWTALPATSDAGCLFGWWRKDPVPQPTLPVTSYYPPGQEACAAPACGPATCEQTVVRYVPETAYKTVWQPVPVTTYRRTVSYNPVNGLPTTCTQPCTTYTYQARRVPYTAFKPVLTTVPTTCPTTPAPAVAPTYAPATTMTAPVATNECSTCGPATGSYNEWTPAPYTPSPNAYTSPSTSAPAYASPSSDGMSATPWTPVEPNAAPYTAPSNSVDPADDRPRIDSDSTDFRSGQRPTNSMMSGSLVQQNSAGGYAPTTAPGYNSSPTLPPSYSPQPYSGGSTYGAADSRNQEVRPLPYASQPANSGTPEPPPMLNAPRANTAMIRPIPTRWAANKIDWASQPAQRVADIPQPAQQLTSAVAPQNVVPVPATSAPLQRFDSDGHSSSSYPSSGWRQVNR